MFAVFWSVTPVQAEVFASLTQSRTSCEGTEEP